MEDQEARFLLAGEEDAFKEKAGSLFSALSGVHYSPTQDVDGFLKSDPLRDGRQPKLGDPHGNSSRQSTRDTASGHRPKQDRSSGASLMPPPRAPASKRRRHSLPEHVKNPSKFTKYSLDDVPDQQMTQKSNTAAALAFLREIDEKRRKEETEEETSEGQKPVFKRPGQKTATRASGGDQCSVTPETDSVSVTQDKPKLKHKSKKEKEIKLSHLEYEDE